MSKFEKSFEKAMRAAARNKRESAGLPSTTELAAGEIMRITRVAREKGRQLTVAETHRIEELRKTGQESLFPGGALPRDEGFQWIEFDARGRSVNLQRGFATVVNASRAAQLHSESRPKSHHVDVFRDILRGDDGPRLARFRTGKPNPGSGGAFSIGDHVRVHGQSFYKGMAGTVEQYVPIGKYSIRWDHAGRDVVPGSVLALNPGLGHHRKPGTDLSHFTHSKPGKVHETERYTRTRLHDPSEFEPGSFRTIDPGRPGHTKLIVARPKGSKKMRVQAILREK